MVKSKFNINNNDYSRKEYKNKRQSHLQMISNSIAK